MTLTLKDHVHAKGLTQWDKAALALASIYPRSADSAELKQLLLDAGVKAKGWNVASILGQRPDSIASTKDGWEFVGDGITVIQTRTNISLIQQDLNGKKFDSEDTPQDSPVVFIGHGRPLLWRELKDFLVDELNLEWEEFNREPQAGRATITRLEELLSRCSFALLIMTAEDDQADGTTRARQNVVHEVGLFQGKLGFGKAIVLLEEDCEDFSNIHGLTHIPFSKGKITTSFEEIRRTLRREGIS